MTTMQLRIGLFICACLSVLKSLPAQAEGPFEFREASLLLNRLLVASHGVKYDPHHAEQWLSRIAPSPALQMVPQRGDEFVYRDSRWIALLKETDNFRQMGGYAVAEKQYRDIITMLRKVRGGPSSDEAFMLDHLAEFYLEKRDFDRAYDTYAEALPIRRHLIEMLTLAPGAAASDALKAQATAVLYAVGGANPTDVGAARKVCRLHLADLLTQLGRLDLARGDLAHANEHLGEAVSISNENGYKHFANALWAIYYQSLVFEKQQRWADADKLWRDAVMLREAMAWSMPYWDTLKEQAAFFARHGDFHAAAEVARRVDAGIAAGLPGGKRMQPKLSMPYPFHSRPWMEFETSIDSYTALSNAALNEIEAIDTWRTDGVEAAAALLKDPIDLETREALNLGSDAERAQMIAWFEGMVSLRMSILLDGTPTQQRIEQAYDLLSQFKGRYLHSMADTSRLLEQIRTSPTSEVADTLTIDQLTAARERHAALFLASALDGAPYDRAKFVEIDNLESILSMALTADSFYRSSNDGFSAKRFPMQIPEGSAFVDICAWERSDRATAARLREYGAFVVRHGLPVMYARMGAAPAIDEDLGALDTIAIGGRARGLTRIEATPAVSVDQAQQKLRALYQKVIAPLEPALQGVTRLYVVPDGRLSLAPIGAFADAAGHYVMERYTITYLTSWRDLRPPPAAPGSAPVIIANPDFALTIGARTKADPKRPVFAALPGTELEAASIERLLKLNHERTLVGDRARKWLVQSLQGPEFLHFATHSEPYLEWHAPTSRVNLFDYPQPLATEDPFLQSVIALAGADHAQSGDESGLLTGLEIASLHLVGTRLVVLSTCESGQGTPLDGQGVMGLRAAFLLAGAQSLVMSLWPVDDQAGALFMQYFYSHIGQGPAQAVRLAQIDMLTQSQYKDPFYWAGYAASGDAQITDAPAAAPTPTAANTPAGDEVFVTPACFEFSTQDMKSAGNGSIDTIQLKVGGVLHRLQHSPNEVVYNVDGPGNGLTEVKKLQINGVTVTPIDIKHANEMRWTVAMTLEKQANHSSLSVRFGGTKYPPEQRRLITLTGGPALFAALTPPDTLPRLAAYTQVTDSWAHGSKFEHIGPCAASEP